MKLPDVTVLDRRRSRFKSYAISTIAGLILGFGSLQLYDMFARAPDIVINEPPKLINMGDYIGILVDRTRNTYCELHPSRLLFMYQQLDGERIPVIYPIPTYTFTWPHLGHIKLIVLLTIPKDLPPGKWSIQSVAYDDCHWYNSLLGDRMIISKPLSIMIGATN